MLYTNTYQIDQFTAILVALLFTYTFTCMAEILIIINNNFLAISANSLDQ